MLLFEVLWRENGSSLEVSICQDMSRTSSVSPLGVCPCQRVWFHARGPHQMFSPKLTRPSWPPKVAWGQGSAAWLRHLVTPGSTFPQPDGHDLCHLGLLWALEPEARVWILAWLSQLCPWQGLSLGLLGRDVHW